MNEGREKAIALRCKQLNINGAGECNLCPCYNKSQCFLDDEQLQRLKNLPEIEKRQKETLKKLFGENDGKG